MHENVSETGNVWVFAAVEELDVPAEALEPHHGEPLTEDDLIELMLEVERWPALPPAA